MADLITTKAAFPKSGGLAVANGAVSVNAGNGLHVNPTTGMVEVPVDTTAGLGYGSNGLEVEVDDSTIGFNASGQLQALGGGGSGASLVRSILSSTSEIKIGNWTLSTTTPSFQLYAIAQSEWLYILSLQLLSNLTGVTFAIRHSGNGETYLNGVNVKDMTSSSGYTFIVGVMGVQTNLNEPSTREYYSRYTKNSNKTEIHVPQYGNGYYTKGMTMALNLIFTYV